MDAFVSRATPGVAMGLLNSAIAGNQNMIRVWSMKSVLSTRCCVCDVSMVNYATGGYALNFGWRLSINHAGEEVCTRLTGSMDCVTSLV